MKRFFSVHGTTIIILATTHETPTQNHRFIQMLSDSIAMKHITNPD
jgi:hypothetical protein